MNRRSILIGIIGVAASALLAACGGGVTLAAHDRRTRNDRIRGRAQAHSPRVAPPLPLRWTVDAVDGGISATSSPIPIPLMLTITPESNYGAYTDPASYVATWTSPNSVRTCDTLATLPDAANATFGKKASDTIPALPPPGGSGDERNVKAGGNPFDDGTADGQRLFRPQ